MEVCQHMCDSFLQQVDKDQKNLKTRELLKVRYDPDRIPQHYYKQISEAQQLLAALKDPVTETEIMRNAFATFEQQIDLKEACRDWTRGKGTTWEQTNATIAQTMEDETNQRAAQEILVLQTKKIQELEKQLKEVANSMTNNNIPGRIPALIDTSDSSKSNGGGGSTTSTVTKDEMMQMFAQFTQNFKPGECTVIDPKETKVGKKKSKFGTHYIQNDLPNGGRSKRRYPDSTSYYPSCGYDIKPTHTPTTCTNRKACHNEAATLANKMGGVTTNCHFVT